MTKGKALASPGARSPTKRELLKRARELGVKGRSRMSKAELADAVARKEMPKPSAASPTSQSAARQVREAVRAVAQQEAEWAERHVRTAAQEEAQSAARQVREAVQAVAQRMALSAERHVREEVQPAPQDSEQVTTQPTRTARHRSPFRFWQIASRFGKAILLPVFLTLITYLVTSNYVGSKIVDRVLRGGSDPVSSRVFYERDVDVQGLTWALPSGLGQLSWNEDQLLSTATESVDEFNSWIRTKGGVDVGASFITLIVTGQRQSGVVITGMQAKIERCGAPLNGALLFAPPEGERKNIQIGFDLDKEPRVAREGNPGKEIGKRGYLGSPYFKNNTITLALGEDQVFKIVALTKRHYCTWYIDVTIFADGSTRHVTVGFKRDVGQKQEPFKITAAIDPGESLETLSAYNELYVLHKKTNPTGFTLVDPRTYVQVVGDKLQSSTPA